MRLLFLMPKLPFPPEKDGMTSIGWHITTRLAARHEVTISCFVDPQDEPHLVNFAHHGIDVRSFRRPQASVIQHYLSRGMTRGWFQAQWHSTEMADMVRHADQSGAFDRIIIHTPFLSLLLNDISATPCVLHAYDALSSWFRQTASITRHPLKRLHLLQEARRADWAERHLYPKATAIVAVAETDAAVFQAAAPTTRVTTIPVGIDMERFHPAKEQEHAAPTLMFTGIMDYQPNIDAVTSFARDVWPALRKRFADLRWQIVGKNPAPDVLALAQADPRIVVTGFVPDMAAALNNATIIIAPLNIGTGFKTKMIEAMAAGKPIVASPSALPGLRATPNVNLMTASTPQEWEARITDLLTNTKARDDIGAAARRHAEAFSWDAIAATYEDLYATLA